MHTPSQLGLDPSKRRPHAVPSGLPVNEEFAPTTFAADEGEPEEGEGFRATADSGTSENDALEAAVRWKRLWKPRGPSYRPIRDRFGERAGYETNLSRSERNQRLSGSSPQVRRKTGFRERKVRARGLSRSFGASFRHLTVSLQKGLAIGRDWSGTVVNWGA